MSASTLSRRRSTAHAEARAAKEKKQKIFLVVAIVLLAVLLAVELPKLMKSSGSSTSAGTATPAPSVVAPTTPGAVTGGKSAAEIKHDLAAIRRLAAHDVFGRAGALGSEPAAGPVSVPAGVRDPFEGTGTAASTPVVKKKLTTAAAAPTLPAQIVVGEKTKNTVASKGWIVILASIPTQQGRTGAASFVAKAAKKGVSGLSILNSSKSKSLRGGYWVVYSGPFKTIQQLNANATAVHSAGFGSAYVRQLVVYHAR